MENKQVSPAVMIGVIAVAVVLIVAIGWHYVNGGRRGPNGQDLSKPAIPPANMSQMYTQQMQKYNAPTKK